MTGLDEDAWQDNLNYSHPRTCVSLSLRVGSVFCLVTQTPCTGSAHSPSGPSSSPWVYYPMMAYVSSSSASWHVTSAAAL